MVGERGLNRNLRGFCITNFFYYDDIRVLAKYGAQVASERYIYTGIYLRLFNVFQFIFYGIFYRQNIAVGSIQRRKDGVERGVFIGVCRFCYQDNIVRKLNEIF